MRFISIVFLLVSSAVACSSGHRFNGDCKPPSHQIWTELLSAHVDSLGNVDYAGFVQNRNKLNSYCSTLSKCHPSSSWTELEKLAFWINSYNAFTVKLIVDHYPISSIKDIKKGIPFINSIWEMKFIQIGGQQMSLGEIEHDILRKEFNEPRIHFAIVCASKSCPQLLYEAFEPEKLEQQLTERTINFINDPNRNEIELLEVRLSSIFKWFKKDFIENGTLVEYIRKYSKTDFHLDAKIKYLDYDWGLNGQ